MTAVHLFHKEKAPPPRVKVGQVSPIAAQLQQWLRRGETEVFTVQTYLTPDLARLLLQRNEGNRPVLMVGGTRSVAAYADAMRRGEWRLNGEPIIMSRCGLMNDGQHRSYGAIEAGCAPPVQITFGVDRDSRHTIDQGIARSPGHILAMWGETNTNALACALQFLWALKAGSLHMRPSTDQLRDTLEQHPEIREALNAVRSLTGHYRLSMGYLAGAHYLCRGYDEPSADMFLASATNGLNIAHANGAVARLRKQFEEHSARRKHLDRIEQAALYVKGFNNHMRGRTGPLAWRNTGPAPEDFPVVGG